MIQVAFVHSHRTVVVFHQITRNRHMMIRFVFPAFLGLECVLLPDCWEIVTLPPGL